MLSTRHLSAVISSFLISTTALAGEGFYVGAGVGYGTLDTKIRVHELAPNIPTPTDIITQDHNTDEGSAIGQIHAGYQWIFLTQSMTFSLAAEGFIDFQSRDYDLSSTSIPNPLLPTNVVTKRTSFKVENTYGLSIKPGVFLTNNIMTYLDIGIVFMQFSDIKTDFGITTVDEQFGHYGDKDRVGLRTGIGLGWLVTKQFTVDLSWAIDSYEDFHESRVVTGEGTINQIDEQIKFNDISNNRFLLDFNYYFDF